MRQSPDTYLGKSPYLTSRITNFIDDLASKLSKNSDDFLFVEPYSIGDAVHTLGLLPAFRKAYCADGQRIIVLCQERALPLSAVMPYADLYFSAPLYPHELALEYIASLSNILTPHLPIICAPDMHASGCVGRAAVNQLAAKKSIFYLRQEDQFEAPTINPALRRDTETHLSNCGVIQGRSLILFPHALSVVDPGLNFWANVVRCINKALPELIICTEISGGGTPIEGTRPLTLPLPNVIPAIEYAGAAVLLRSGLVDLAAYADAAVISVVPPAEMYRFIPKSKSQEDLFISKIFPTSKVVDFSLVSVEQSAVDALSTCIMSLLVEEEVR